MLLLAGVLAALIEARGSGRGQVVDAAMVDGTVALLAMFFGFREMNLGDFRDATGENLLAGAAPYYDTYRTLDGRYVAFGALEPQFYGELLDKLGLDRSRYGHLGYPAVDDTARSQWPALREAIAAAVATRTRDEWSAIFEGSDACYAPVLSLAEAARHPHNVARGTFIEVDGVQQNAPAPRFSRTPAAAVRGPRPPGADTESVLRDAGMSADDIERLRAAGAVP
jgi:alpha-methylacyl-CoA racemase